MNGEPVHPIRNGQINFNTAVGVIVLAVIGWVGNKTAANNDALTEIRTQLPYMTQSVAKLEGQISLLVTRSELESRLSEVTAKAAVLDRRIMQLEFEKNVNRPKEPQ